MRERETGDGGGRSRTDDEGRGAKEMRRKEEGVIEEIFFPSLARKKFFVPRRW